MPEPKYSDAFLLAILRKAARRVNRRLCLTGTPNEIVVDSSGNITPDNPDLEDILLLQAECLISQTEFQQELRDNDAGTLVRDGEQTVDTRTAGIARGTFYDSPNSPCQEVTHAIMRYKLDNQQRRMVY